MTMHLHVLNGCSPAPLANYLKALGILRLVGEQADREARGWWEGERFCLLTELSKRNLEEFFLERYEPTPIFNPWGGRSGYYSGSPEKTSRAALTAIERSTSERLAKFRSAISLVRSTIGSFGGEKPESDESKNALIATIRRELRGAGSEWLDTVLADFGGAFRGPAIFGTGGNEGSGSYTAAFLSAVVECVIRRDRSVAIASSLWSDGADRDAWDGSFRHLGDGQREKKEAVAQPFRQFMPTGAGSPWDLLLAFEGAVVVQSGVVRRSISDQHRFLSSPFYFAPLGVGAASSSAMDEFVINKGRKNQGRGEQWFPLWSYASTAPEVQSLFREGRCSNGRLAARNPLSAVLAISGAGTTRGIGSFIRYGYLQRDNLATHFAVPLGRITVREHSSARLVDDLSGWIDRIHRAARSKGAPSRLDCGHRVLSNAVFAALTHDHTHARWQTILLAAANIEALQATGTGIEAGPIPPLRPEWISAVDDGSPEVRLAIALGSAAAGFTRDGRHIDDPVRFHWLPLEANLRRFRTKDKRLVQDPRVVARGRDPLRDLVAVVERRLIEADRSGKRRSGLVAAPGCGARLEDVARFLSDSLDLDRLLRLARAFMAIRWARWAPRIQPPVKRSPDLPDEAWLAVRLACLPWPLTTDLDVPVDPRVVRLLASGDATRAVDIARARLRGGGRRRGKPGLSASLGCGARFSS
jgi:CRISPR-associated protein Csx17